MSYLPSFSPFIHRAFFRIALLLGVVATVGLTSSCAVVEAWNNRVPPIRTLPSWVRGVYIPMFENESFEIGLTETATRMTQEEFLADGRVDIVPKRDADLVLKAVIIEYDDFVESEDSDEIPELNRVTMRTKVLLYDPLVPEIPVADLGQIVTSQVYRSDPRSVRYVTDPEVEERLMRVLARQIVNRTINGYPAALRSTPEGVPVPGPTREAPTDFGNLLETRTEFGD